MDNHELFKIGEADLSLADVMKLGSECFRIELSDSAIDRIKLSNFTLNGLLMSGGVFYGVNTGFGQLAGVRIKDDETRALQTNLIRQSAAGVGEPLSPERVRRMLILRINAIAQGYSGTKLETVLALVDAYNNNRLPLVPQQGTVGASGDLAPLAHLALGVFGEGELITGDRGKITARLDSLGPKEGLSLINGTQFITALAAEAVSRAQLILEQSLIVAALSVEVLKGAPSAYDKDLQTTRRQRGQVIIAERMHQLLPNENNKSAFFEMQKYRDRVQDAYSIRCIPQIIGAVFDSIKFVASIIENEINAVTDNPLVFVKRQDIISGGNFHGQYPAKAMDILAMSVHDIANISERRTERLLNASLSQNLPAFLTLNGGLHSGYMIAQYTQAALVSENKTLCHPASVDTIPTCANQEDFVSMGGWAARKALNVVTNVERVVAIELLCACQALDLRRREFKMSTLTTTPPLQAAYDLVRKHVPFLEEDRELRSEIELVRNLLLDGIIKEVVASVEGHQWTCQEHY